MADAHRCLDCRFADWKRTKAGALHQSGDGICRWEFKPPVIAAAFRWRYPYLGNAGKAAPTPDGGYISRREPIAMCPVFQRRGVWGVL